MKVKNVSPQNQIVFKTRPDEKDPKRQFQWWKAKNKKELLTQILSTAAYLKENQSYRFRQAAVYSRLYGNQSLFSFIGTNSHKMDQATGLPLDRPTFNIVQSCIDTLVSRIGQNRPSPVFLTDNGDYRQRKLGKQLTDFVSGEFYRTKTYEKAVTALRDALVTGDGIIKIYESPEGKVELDRVFLTELAIDPNEGMYGEPRQLYQYKLVDRQVLMESFPEFKSVVEEAPSAYPDNSSDASKTVADLVMVVEGWHLPSIKGADDGRHTIACASGLILDEDYQKDKFPFVFIHFAPRLMGFWSQGLAEQLMGTQMEINSLLFTISRSIKMVGVPRVFVEEGSKVTSTSFSNDVGAIIKYRGTKPVYEVAPCVPQEMYAQLQRLIDYGYQQSGVSALQASSQKPAGLNSGEAIRSYDDISTDRFATLSKRYDTFFVDLAYQIIDLAKDIVDREGSYDTVYPSKDGTQEIDLPAAKLLDKNPFVIQVFNTSSLPKEPAGRMQKITEMIQAGMITIKEGRRLLDYPDLEQVETLANASEERIFKILDEIVEDGKYTPPDPFMDLELATELTVQYYNLYSAKKLEEERCEMLRTFFSQINTLKAAAMPPAPPQPGPIAPQANPEPLPQSPLVPNAVPQGAVAA